MKEDYHLVLSFVTDTPKTVRRIAYEAYGDMSYDRMTSVAKILLQIVRYGDAIRKKVRILGSFKPGIVYARPGTEIPDEVMDPCSEAFRPAPGFDLDRWADVTRRAEEHYAAGRSSIEGMAKAIGISASAARRVTMQLLELRRIVHDGRIEQGRDATGHIRYIYAYKAVVG